LGITISVKPVQPRNALLGILVPPFIITVLSEAGTELAPPNKETNVPLVIGNVMLVKPVQPSNASKSMIVTLLGMVMSVKPVQPWNAPQPMNITLLGMVMLVKPTRPWNAKSPMPTVSALKIKLLLIAPLNPTAHLSA
jgi:hypothetical protein